MLYPIKLRVLVGSVLIIPHLRKKLARRNVLQSVARIMNTYLHLLIVSLYILAFLTLVVILVRFIVRGTLFIYAAIAGAPFVPTRANISQILQAVPIAKGSRFLEVGCGNGRVVETAVNELGVVGCGIDIDPLLIASARGRTAKRYSEKVLTYQTKNIHTMKLDRYDTFYLFLLPKLLTRVANHIVEDRAKRETLVISHAFQIELLNDALIHVQQGVPYETYYYRINPKTVSRIRANRAQNLLS